MRRFMKWILGIGALAATLGALAYAWFVWWPVHTIPPIEHVDEYVWLDQGWGAGQNAELRQRYYYTAQGTSMPQGASDGAVRYSWFVNLELPLSRERFASPDNMRRLRFLVDPEPSPANPDQLPIGFTRHFDAHIGEYVLDITCAACHTGEIQHTANGRTRAIRIDGGPAMHAFTDMQRGNFAPSLAASLLGTTLNPWKFDRFAKKVLGESYPGGKSRLRKAMKATIDAMISSGQNDPARKLYTIREGFGRTDALGRIGNTAFGDHLSAANYQAGLAPVSYPYVWNIWKFDWVQYNGSVAQPLARNVGEALGVGAVAPLLSSMRSPLPPEARFRSSVDIAGLVRIEHTLHMLRPPPWPEEILGTIDRAKAARGAELFVKHCQECHGPHVSEAARQQSSAPLKPGNGLEWRIEVIPLDHIGTDPAAAQGFMDRRYDLSSTGLHNAELQGALRPLMLRDLLRDVRFRLREVVRLRSEAKLPPGDLPAVLAAYPDPDATAVPSLPAESFAAIDAALKIADPLPQIPGPEARPYDPLGCALNCHLRNLAWDLRQGTNYIEHVLGSLDVKQLTEGAALNLVGILIKNKYYADHGIDWAKQQCIEGFGALDLPQQVAGYKPRPLEGVWATAPFLHNGSVPTLYQMLLPPEKRDRKFFVGRREYDPVHVGYVTQPDADGDDDGFWLDTTIDGNHNTGHAFSADAATWAKHLENPKANPLPHGVIGPEFSDEQRYDIIEYLKVHRDLPETPADYRPPACGLPGEAS
ncbi:MAG TPA: di-heme-cytochrome C peroxidase [Steroidobacteraceae bacterium]|jgi:mono/diheme cytochrome c family protein|nr:di-heme-cytochrome C peroxidase [Steroidobacteraceae bacterium]